jgi:hypothetical protein
MASWANKIAFKLRGAENWPWADATVSDLWTEQAGKATNMAILSYTFWHEGHIYSGISWAGGTSETTAYEKGDRIQVQFNPADPNQCYFPEQESLSAALYSIIGVLAAIPLVLLVWYGIAHMNR